MKNNSEKQFDSCQTTKKKSIPLKIAWVVHNPNRNEGRVYKESQTLAHAGYEVTIFAMWEEGLPVTEQQGDVNIIRLPSLILHKIKFPFKQMRSGLLWISYQIQLLIHLIAYKPNIIHCMNFYTLHIGYLMKKLFNVPYVYDSHDLFIGQLHMNNKPPLIKRLFMLREKFLAKNASAVIQTTESRKKQFEKWYNISAQVIMNKTLSPTLGKNVSSTHNHPEICSTSKKKLVYVGSVTQSRGLEQLIEATRNMNDVQIFILGHSSGAFGNNLLGKNKERIVFLPAVKQDEVAQALQVFDLGITLIQNSCLSYCFSCPTKLWELMSAGIPQIASDFPEIRKVIIENEIGPIGRVVNPNDIKEIQNAIIEMLANPEEMYVYRQNCLKLREILSWEKESQKLVRLYHSLCT